jgi:hypothetical protein
MEGGGVGVDWTAHLLWASWHAGVWQVQGWHAGIVCVDPLLLHLVGVSAACCVLWSTGS